MRYPYLHAIRYRKHAEIDKFVDFRLMLQEKYDLESRTYSAYSGPMVQHRQWGFHDLNQVVNECSRKDLHNLLDIILDIDDDYRLTVSCDDGYIYTNHLSKFDKVFSDTYAEYIGTREVQCDVPDGCIRIRNSAYKFRTYFSEQILELSQAESLASILINQDGVRMSPALTVWADSKGKYGYVSYWKSKMSVLRGSYFIDHDELGILTLLSLVTPLKVKRTLQIINDK